MTGILDKIPAMTLGGTVSLWRNALGTLEKPAKASQHSLAQQVIQAIGAEWERRRRNTLNPGDTFTWPSTEATGGSGNLDGADWLKEGILKFMGYKVGNADGEPQAIRKRILAEIFSGPLPPAFPNSYLDEWGDPLSAPRLQKMAETIASFARNAKRRRDSQMDTAIRDWEKDLDYLYNEYYVVKFHFAWPMSAV